MRSEEGEAVRNSDQTRGWTRSEIKNKSKSRANRKWGERWGGVGGTTNTRVNFFFFVITTVRQ